MARSRLILLAAILDWAAGGADLYFTENFYASEGCTGFPVVRMPWKKYANDCLQKFKDDDSSDDSGYAWYLRCENDANPEGDAIPDGVAKYER